MNGNEDDGSDLSKYNVLRAWSVDENEGKIFKVKGVDYQVTLDTLKTKWSYLSKIKSEKERWWRSEVIEVRLRINGRIFNEVYNRMLHSEMNLILYLIKFLKLAPKIAAKKAEEGDYGLYHKRTNRLITG